jgi:hypothetical protein
MTVLKAQEQPGPKSRIKKMGQQSLASFYHLAHPLVEKMSEVQK